MSIQIDNDNLSVVSDITDNSNNNSIDNNVFEYKFSELVLKLGNSLELLSMNALKEKHKELGLANYSKLTKQLLISVLISKFVDLLEELKQKKVNDLKNICKQHNIKILGSSKKENLLLLIFEYLQINQKCSLQIDTNINNTSNNTVELEKQLTLMEQLEKQKQEIEQKMKEEIEKAKIIAALEEAKKKEEEEKKKAEEIAILEEEKKKEKEEQKKKKQSIPKNVRVIVWNHYIGEDIIKHKCLCCKKVTISNTNFEVGHVLSEKNGGTHEINNLRPICFACNHSMGTENMIDFVVKFGLYIG